MNASRSPITRALAVIAVVFTTLLAPIGALSAAQAAELSGVITGITTTPTNPTTISRIRTTVTWCVPSNTKEGDTFGLTLPVQLVGVPTPFFLRDPDGKVVAEATVSTTCL